MKIRPQHPALNDTIGIHLDLEGAKVKTADIEVGFQHHGLEKRFETATYEEGVGIADRVHEGRPRMRQRIHQESASALGYVTACEELLAVVPPERAQVLRVILAELMRLGDHLTTLRLQARAASAEALAGRLAERQRLVDDTLEEIVGDHGDGPLFRIGGLRSDIAETALESLAGILEDFPVFLTRLVDGTLLQRLFAMRLRGTGTITREEALAHGLTGPPLRASGVDLDIRKARAYCGYERYDFAIPTQEGGDSWARFVQRVEECHESLRIIAQARDDLRPGAVAPETIGPEMMTPEMISEMASEVAPAERARSATESVSSPLTGEEIYSSIEAPSGELGYFLVAANPSRPYRVRVRAPSFYHAAALSGILVGERLADVPLVVASFGLVAGEIDR